MDLYELPFAKIIILRDNLAEVLINDEVEMNLEMVEQYHQFLLSHLQAPFSLLVNKVNAYTYNFAAQQKLATLEEIDRMAVIAYNRVTRTSTEYLAKVPRSVNWNLKVFSTRDSALAWLDSPSPPRSS
jgi:hypothetical protein